MVKKENLIKLIENMIFKAEKKQNIIFELVMLKEIIEASDTISTK